MRIERGRNPHLKGRCGDGSELSLLLFIFSVEVLTPRLAQTSVDSLACHVSDARFFSPPRFPSQKVDLARLETVLPVEIFQFALQVAREFAGYYAAL